MVGDNAATVRDLLKTMWNMAEPEVRAEYEARAV